MALELLFEDDSVLPPDQIVKVAQTYVCVAGPSLQHLFLIPYVSLCSLCDLFSPSSDSKGLQDLKQRLVTYSNLLTTSKLSNHVLTEVPLSVTLDPSRPTALPTRF